MLVRWDTSNAFCSMAERSHWNVEVCWFVFFPFPLAPLNFTFLYYLEPCDKKCNISCRSKIFWLLTEVTSNQESVLEWIHAVTDILKIYNLILNRMILFDENKQKFLNPWLVCILKHRRVTRQIPGLMSLPLTLTAKKSTKIFRTTRYIAILITGFHDIGTLSDAVVSY